MASFSLFLWSIWPHPQIEYRYSLPEVLFEDLNSSIDGTSGYKLPAGIEVRLLIPRYLQYGKPGIIDLYIAQPPDSTLISLDYLETHNLIAETRLDWLTVQIDPQSSISQPLNFSHPLHFQWEVTPFKHR